MLLDHLVLVVDDLPTAVTQFESKGFSVTPGGTNGPTHNALIVFADDTYIELISLQSSRTRFIMRMLRRLGVFALRGLFATDLQTRLLGWMSGPQGLIDLCFRGADLAQITESSPLHSLSLTEPVRFKRYRPDGLVVEWTLRGSKTLRQPFYIQDRTPIEYRIPMGDARTHANGALGILEVRTRECIEVSASNVELKQDPSLQPGSISVSVSTGLGMTEHISGPDFFNANVTLLPGSGAAHRS